MSTPTKLIELLTGKVFKVRGEAVVLDFDAASLYEAGIDQLHKSVTRHHQRFPDDFMFRLTPSEWDEICIQIFGERRTIRSKPPLAFTNAGLFMLSSVLKGPRAAQISVLIIESLFSYKKIIDKDEPTTL